MTSVITDAGIKAMKTALNFTKEKLKAVSLTNSHGTITTGVTGTIMPGITTTRGAGVGGATVNSTRYARKKGRGERRGYVTITVEMIKDLFRIKSHLEIVNASVDAETNQLLLFVKDPQGKESNIPIHAEGAQSTQIQWEDIVTIKTQRQYYDQVVEPGLQGKMMDELLKKDKQE